MKKAPGVAAAKHDAHAEPAVHDRATASVANWAFKQLTLVVLEPGRPERYPARSIRSLDLRPVDPEVSPTQFSDFPRVALRIL